MEFQIVSCKGTETFVTTATASEWLEEYQPATAEVHFNGQRVELQCRDEDGWEDTEALRIQIRCAVRDAKAMAALAD
jgi:hypothetical protein